MRSLPSDNRFSPQTLPYEMEDFSKDEQRAPESGALELFRWEDISNEREASPVGVAPTAFVGKVFDDSGADGGLSQNSAQDDSNSQEDELQKKRSEVEDQAASILEDARAEAEVIKEAARQEGQTLGYEEGLRNGRKDAEAQQQQLMQEALQKYLTDIQKAIEDIQTQKDQIFDEYKDSLRDLAIAIAEKVINVSLKSSGQIIEKMIVAATDRMSNKQWAKISISKYDADVMVQGDMDILAAMKNVSDNVTIAVMEGAEPGTCVIEFPDQIIDASVNTQLDNIKELLS